MPQKFRQKAILEGASRLMRVRLPSQILGAVQGSDRTLAANRATPLHQILINQSGGWHDFLGCIADGILITAAV